ncbi:wings apart-like protein homolog [Clytia hemisphaerica]|uniref:WAPL domain-containing protein n=1 Tax=Clytia hemisphaerica TaxID=252671 RepID=A0A7M5XCL5_9CNID
MPKVNATKRKAYTYGGQKKSDNDGWKEIAKSPKAGKVSLPKSKGIWTSISVSPFKKSPFKEPTKRKENEDDDPFSFNDMDADCFDFKENGINVSPKKNLKVAQSPRSASKKNPLLSGKALPEESQTINVSDLKENKKKTGKTDLKGFKKGTLAALKAELSSPKKSPTKSPSKRTTKQDQATKSPKKGSLAALQAKLQSPKKNNTKAKETKPRTNKKSPPSNTSKKSPTTSKSSVVSNKAPSKSAKPVKKSAKSPTKTTTATKDPTISAKAATKKSPTKANNSPAKKSSKETKKSPVKAKKSPVKIMSKKVKVSSAKKVTPKTKTEKIDSKTKKITLEKVPVKPKAGRPKKKITSPVKEKILVEKENDTKPKRGRGRPARKIPQTESEASQEPPSKRAKKSAKVSQQASQELTEPDIEMSGESEEIFPKGDEDKKGVDITGDSCEEDSNEQEEPEDVITMSSEDTQEESTVSESQEAEENNIESNDNTEDLESVEGEEEEPVKKTKSVFAYYDKPKNIFAESKKNVIFNDDDDDFGNDLAAVEVDRKKKDQMKKSDGVTPSTPEKSGQNSEVIRGGEVDKEKKLVKSPFKSLNPNFRKYRRFSALPTDITMAPNDQEEISSQEYDNENEENGELEKSSFLHMTNIFGQSGSSAFRVRKDEKELYTVVRDTKHAYQCLEHGETQLFKDDLEYLLDGLKSSQNTSTRCLSALNLASKCLSPEFRMHMKAHGVFDSIFSLLQDAHTDELLSLCTSSIMYIISKDRQKTGFSKKMIAFVLNILTKAPSTQPSGQKTSEKINNKVKDLFEKYDDSVIDSLNVTSGILARETLLSLTSQKTGEWFKEDIRILGGLDHICDEIYSSSRCMQKREELIKHFKQTERCLLLLCDITFRCSKNQEHLALYREGLLISSLVRIITFITTKVDLSEDFDTTCQSCLFAILRFLTNLSHENETGSVKICKQEDALNCFMRCVLYMPQFLAENKTFDFIVVALGLLINLTEHSKQNIEILNTAFGPACYESENSSSIDDEVSPVESLTRLFLVRNEASKDGDLMEELERLEKEQDEKDAEMHYHDGEDALVCGDKFDDTVEESDKDTIMKEEGETKDGETKEEEKASTSGEKKPEESAIQLNKKEKEDIKNTLEKAHQHMEDSHVAAYSALLIGLLAERNKENQDSIHALLPNGDFLPMQTSLEKILAFMKMTGATNEAGFKVIQRIIDFFKECCQKYQGVTSNES